MLTCASCGRENPDGSRFCNACGAELTPDQAAREYRKVVTILFCDVVGSTAIGESTDPEALRALLGRYFDEMKAIVERHGGSVEKFIGDAVMAVFGVPQLHEDDALRAVRAAVEMRDALPSLGVQARIGVNTGEVVVGTSERLATGDAVNVAARLEQAAGAGQVLLGPETARLVRDAVETEEVTLELKGKSEPLGAYRLLAIDEEAPGFARRLDAPLVGRERELRRLREAFAQAAADRSCQLFTILGTAGVGKSRLTAEFVDGLDDSTRVVHGRCLPYGEGITYWPVVEVVKQLPPAEALGLELAAIAAIERLLGEESGGTSDEIPWAVRKLLEAAAQARPLVVVFDDIHCAEPTFLDLAEHVADLSRDAPLLLLCLARPELLERRPGWGGGKLNATTILLEPLSAAETDELLERLLGDASLAPDLQRRIREAAEGNPLFVEEMVALVEDSGDGEVAVPGTIHALLAARLDQLDPAERGVLERGAVEGRIFHRGAVQALAPEEAHVETRLNGLVRKELVRPDTPQLVGEDAYRFRHLLIRDTAYEALPKATRAELHERFADWLETHAGELVELDEVVGYHLEQACRYRVELGTEDPELAARASERLAAAARRALRLRDAAAGANLLERAVALSEPRGREGVELLLDLGTVLIDRGQLREAAARREEAIELARSIGDRVFELKASCDHAILRTVSDPEFTGNDALAIGRAAIGELGPDGDDQALASAWFLVSAASNLRGRWQDALAAAEQVLEHARNPGDRWRSEAREFCGPALFWGPTPLDEALPRVEALLASARDEKSLTAWAIRPVAGFYAMQGRFDEARALLAEARAILEELGRTVDIQTLAFWIGPLELMAGNAAEAERVSGEACAFLEAAGERGWLSTMAGFRSTALYELGRLDEAEVAALQSRAAATSDDANAQAGWRAALAKVLAHKGEHEEAARLVEEAIAFTERTDELDNQGYLYLDAARVYQLADNAGRAETALRAALERFEQKGNAVLAQRARALLRELGAASTT
jgi:class 3 adenylate cyclase/tetratricopeptide (TPR) repeat protein